MTMKGKSIYSSNVRGDGERRPKREKEREKKRERDSFRKYFTRLWK